MICRRGAGIARRDRPPVSGPTVEPVRYVSVGRQRLRLAIRRGTGDGPPLLLCSGLGWTSLLMLPLTRQPTLVLAGTDDPIIPLINARIMSRLLPDATLHVYDEGHLGLLTKAPELGHLVSQFLLDETH